MHLDLNNDFIITENILMLVLNYFSHGIFILQYFKFRKYQLLLQAVIRVYAIRTMIIVLQFCFQRVTQKRL